MKNSRQLLSQIFPWLIFALIACFVGTAIMVSWRNAQISPEQATSLLQQKVQERHVVGAVSNVSLGSSLCTEAILGNSCRMDVSFAIDGEPAAGWCTYGVNQPKMCGVTTWPPKK
jgi:hypothetical protein